MEMKSDNHHTGLTTVFEPSLGSRAKWKISIGPLEALSESQAISNCGRCSSIPHNVYETGNDFHSPRKEAKTRDCNCTRTATMTRCKTQEFSFASCSPLSLSVLDSPSNGIKNANLLRQFKLCKIANRVQWRWLSALIKRDIVSFW
jgi:hypothetical protein